LIFTFFAVLLAFPTPSEASVDVNPRIYDFGYVQANSSRMVTVVFSNRGSDVIRDFRTYCSGDLSVYQCFSSCFQLQPWGSCTVQVRFSPRFGDRQRHSLTVHGQGSGNYVSSLIYGIDTL